MKYLIGRSLVLLITSLPLLAQTGGAPQGSGPVTKKSEHTLSIKKESKIMGKGSTPKTTTGSTPAAREEMITGPSKHDGMTLEEVQRQEEKKADTPVPPMQPKSLDDLEEEDE